MKTWIGLIAAFLILLGGVLISALTTKVTVTELKESKYLGVSFNSPMYWAATINLKPSAFKQEAELDKLSSRKIIDIGTVVHYRDEDFANGMKSFEYIAQNQTWKVERVFHVEGNKRGLWLGGRPDYNYLLTTNIQNGNRYFVRDTDVDMILDKKDYYKRMSDYDKFANILDAQKNQDSLLILVEIGNYKDGATAEKLPSDQIQRKVEVDRLESLILDKLPADLKPLVKEKGDAWPTITFELNRDQFLKLYSYKYNFGVYTKFAPLFKS